MQQVKGYTDDPFPTTYNDKYEPHELPEGACALIQNGFLDYRSVRERTGYTLYGNDTGENKPNLLLHEYLTGTYHQLLKVNDNAGGTAANLFYKNAVGNWVQVASPTFTAGLKLSAVTAQGAVYITNGVDVVKKWNGATLSNVATIPIGKYLIWYHNFLWSVNTAGFTSRAYFSVISSPELFNVLTDFIDVSPDDGDEINAVNTLKDELLFFKRYRIYGFEGWDELAFTPQALNTSFNGYGAFSNRGVVNTGNDLLFGSYLGNVSAVRSLIRTQFGTTEYGDIVSDPIEGSMTLTNYSQLDKTASVYDGKYAWFFMPLGSSTYNDGCFVWDTVIKGWSKHTGIYAAQAIKSTIGGKVQVYFADSRNSKVYVMDGSNSDNGTAIDFQFITREFHPDFKRPFKFKYVWTEYEAVGGTGTLDLYSSTDGNSFQLEENLTLVAPSVSIFSMTFNFIFGDSIDRLRRTDLSYSSLHHSFMLKYAKSNTGPRTSIHHYEISAIPRSLRDSK